MQYLRTKDETYEAMKSLAHSIQELAGQLNRLNGIPTSCELRSTMTEFPDIMKEVVDFIWGWLKSWMCMYQSIEICS